MTPEELVVRFTYHPPVTDDQKLFYEDYRKKLYAVADYLTFVLPESRELSLAITALEEACFWGNACAARRGTKP